MEKSIRLRIVLILFLLAVLWYFFPLGKEVFPRDLFRMRLALPAGVLALGSIGLVPGLISVGFVFCTIGDAMGVAGSFEGQVAGFAVAQICFISQFVKDIRNSSRNLRNSTGEIRPLSYDESGSIGEIRNSTCEESGSLGRIRWMAYTVAGMVCMIPLIVAAVNIMPGVKSLPLRIGCIVYALLLSGSLFTSILRCFSVGRYVAMIGCAIFLVSDFIIAWNKFAEHIPHAGLYIMITYYAALLLIFLGTLHLFSRKSKVSFETGKTVS